MKQTLQIAASQTGHGLYPSDLPAVLSRMAREKTDLDPVDETNRLLATLIRLQLGNQAEAIQELHRAGIGVSRIAQLLGTTPGTANVAVQRAKKKPKATHGGKS